MARSYRQTPVFGITTADSEKDDKRHANRLLRRRVRFAIVLLYDPLPALREVSNVWGFARDGKVFWPEATPRDMRK